MSNDDLVNRGIIKRTTTVNIDTDTAISGQITVTTAGTSVQGGNVDLTNGVWVKALKANTGIIYIASTSGDNRAKFELSAGELIPVQVGNLNELYFDASVSGEKACWLKA